MVQWLGLSTLTAQGTKIPQASQHGQKKKKNHFLKKCNYNTVLDFPIALSPSPLELTCFIRKNPQYFRAQPLCPDLTETWVSPKDSSFSGAFLSADVLFSPHNPCSTEKQYSFQTISPDIPGTLKHPIRLCNPSTILPTVIYDSVVTPAFFP